MIRSLRVKNFQKHKDLTLKLDPHVTTIVGPNDAGKSAILRALRWVALGQPRGKDFIRHGKKQASALLKVGKHLIKRVRGAKSSYVLDDQVLSAFGNNVPDEVAKILNVDSVNFQGQHDPVFWFSLPPGHVSRELNKIVDLEVIDTTLKKLADMSRKTNIEERVVTERFEEATAERKKLLPALKANKALIRLERLHKQLSKARKRATALRKLVSSARRSLARGEQLGRAHKQVLALTNTLRFSLSAQKQFALLKRLVSKAKKLSDTASKNVRMPRALRQLAKALSKAKAKRDLLAKTIELAMALAWSVETNEMELLLHEKELERIKVCPLCGNKIRSSRLRAPTSTCHSGHLSRVQTRLRGLKQ